MDTPLHCSSGAYDPDRNIYYIYGGGTGPAGVSSQYNDLVRIAPGAKQ